MGTYFIEKMTHFKLDKTPSFPHTLTSRMYFSTRKASHVTVFPSEFIPKHKLLIISKIVSAK